MDVNPASAGTNVVSSLPLQLRTDAGRGLFGARREAEVSALVFSGFTRAWIFSLYRENVFLQLMTELWFKSST